MARCPAAFIPGREEIVECFFFSPRNLNINLQRNKNEGYGGLQKTNTDVEQWQANKIIWQ
jgi:hypothetical protein